VPSKWTREISLNSITREVGHNIVLDNCGSAADFRLNVLLPQSQLGKDSEGPFGMLRRLAMMASYRRDPGTAPIAN
jgi:hypothetical protein